MLTHQYKLVFSIKGKENIDNELFDQSDVSAITEVEVPEEDNDNKRRTQGKLLSIRTRWSSSDLPKRR